jgi:preprotein translocase subunit YajC
MTVQELIKILETLNPETRVVIKGYEGGVDDVQKVIDVFIALDKNTEWYYGKHEVVTSNKEYDEQAYVII